MRRLHAETQKVVREEADDIKDEVHGVREEVKALREDLVEQALPFVKARETVALTNRAPDPVDVFTGRKPDVKRVIAALEERRCVNLYGLGGIGKTELTRKVAEVVQAKHPSLAASGVWYVDLSSATSASDLVSLIASNWGITDGADSGAALGSRLNAPRLYLLDDVEQAWTADGQAAAVRTLVEAFCAYAPDARLLVTSRTDLSATGVTPERLEGLPEADALALFEAIALEANGYAYQPGDEARRDALLRDLDGIPLAITLVASLLGPPGASDYDLAEVARRWGDLIEKEAGDGADKNHSLRVSLTLSYEALTDSDSRSLFSLFADLPGGADASLIRAAFVTDDDPEGDAGPDAARLLRKRGLLRQTEDGRYAMRVPVRAFAAKHPTDDLPAHRERLDAYLLALAQFEDGRWETELAEASAVLTTELPNLEAALDRNADVSAFVAVLTDGLDRYYAFAVTPEAKVRLAAGRDAALAANEQGIAANCESSLGNVHYLLDEYGEALSRYESALQGYRAIGARLGAANCEMGLGEVHRLQGEYLEARQRYESALEEYRAIDDRLGMANCELVLGEVHRLQGEYVEARQRYETALDGYRATGERLGAANCEMSLGEVFVRQGEYVEARQRYETALDGYRAIGDRLGAANCEKSLGDMHRQQGKYVEARQRYETALDGYRAIGDRLGAANCVRNLGELQLQHGEYEEARQRYETALEEYLDIGARLGAANCEMGLGEVFVWQGEYEEARLRFKKARQIFEAIGSPYGVMQVLTDVGKLEQAEGNPSGTCAAWREAEGIAVSLGLGQHPMTKTLRGWIAEVCPG